MKNLSPSELAVLKAIHAQARNSGVVSTSWVDLGDDVEAWARFAGSLRDVAAAHPDSFSALVSRVMRANFVAIAARDVGRRDADAFRVGPGEDWCAYAVTAWMAEAGFPVPKPTESARRGARACGVWVGERGVPVLTPKQCAQNRRLGVEAWRRAASLLEPGDVVAWRASESVVDWRGHVALIVAVDGDSIETVGGNEGGKVSRSALPLERWVRRRPGGVHVISRPAVRVEIKLS